jgi:predicted ester cyclase
MEDEMGIEENKQTVAWFDRLTAACEADSLDDICTPDMINHALAASRSAGLEGTKQFLRECRQDPGKAAWMRAMMADQSVVTTAEADYVVQFGRRTGTWPGGHFRGAAIPAGDYGYDVAFMYRFRDGRIAERWAVRDDLAMIQQLGGRFAPNDSASGTLTTPDLSHT